MDPILFLLLRDLTRTFRNTSAVVLIVFIAFSDTPIREGLVYVVAFGELLIFPEPAVYTFSCGIVCEIVLAVLKWWQPKLYEIRMEEDDD